MFSSIGADVVLCPCFIHFSGNGSPVFNSIFTLSDAVISDMSARQPQLRPDLVVYDRAFFAGRVLAHMWNLPAITTTSGLSFNKADTTELSSSTMEWREVEARFSGSVDSFLARHGINEELSYFHDEPLNIYLYPEIYQLPGDSFGNGHVYAGRCAAERPYRYVPRAAVVSENRPVVLVSSSTAYVPGPEYFDMCVRALSALDLHIILFLNGNFDSAVLEPLPSHCEISQGAPLIQMLPHADLLVCMGGPVTASEAMYHAVPLLMLTMGSRDLEVYADNSVRIGIGVHLTKPETSVESVRHQAASIISNPSLAKHMKQLQRAVRREAGGEEIANSIEDHMLTVLRS